MQEHLMQDHPTQGRLMQDRATLRHDTELRSLGLVSTARN